jgi:hypothetical protein
LAAVVLIAAARSRAKWIAPIFMAITAIGPLAWLAYNWWVSGNALEFYNGPYSPKAIQGGIPYPGQGNWRLAVIYLLSAGKLTSGAPLFWLGCAGCIVLISKRVVWPTALLAAPSLLVICSIHSGGTPIQLPGMPYPDSWYNTRYGISLLPLFAFSVAAIVISVAPRWRKAALWLVILAVVAPWFFKRSPIGSYGRKPKSTPRRGAPGPPRPPATSKRTFVLGTRSSQARGMSTEFFEQQCSPRTNALSRQRPVLGRGETASRSVLAMPVGSCGGDSKKNKRR